MREKKKKRGVQREWGEKKEKGMERRGERGEKEEKKATEEVVGEGEALRNQGEFAAHSRSAG